MFDDTRSTLSNHSQTTVRGPVESPGTDGFAITAFVCGLVGLVPFSIGFGIRALIRTGDSGRPGRGLAITGLVLSLLWLGVGAGLTVSSKASRATAAPDYIQGMAIGECLDSDADYEQVIRMPCDAPHDEQIADRVDVSGGYETYPGPTPLRELADPLCRLASAATFANGTPPPGLEFLAHIPTESSWSAGSREATCTFRRQGGKLTAFVPR
ncbi:septum formation family protein [Amycolatopsis sp. NPDC004378]